MNPPPTNKVTGGPGALLAVVHALFSETPPVNTKRLIDSSVRRRLVGNIGLL